MEILKRLLILLFISIYFRDAEAFKPECCWEEAEQDDSSACSDASLTDFTLDDEGKWHCPPKDVWKPTVEVRERRYKRHEGRH